VPFAADYLNHSKVLIDQELNCKRAPPIYKINDLSVMVRAEVSQGHVSCYLQQRKFAVHL